MCVCSIPALFLELLPSPSPRSPVSQSHVGQSACHFSEVPVAITVVLQVPVAERACASGPSECEKEPWLCAVLGSDM